jgi:heavy metal efflux system protein
MPTISLQEGNAYVNEMRKLIRSRPEVESVVSQHGRSDDGTDAAGLFNVEFFAPLKPASEWPDTHDKEELTAQLLAQLQDRFPGVEFNFSQYLQDNVSEAVSGVKGENSIKLYGNDLQAVSDTAMPMLRKAGEWLRNYDRCPLRPAERAAVSRN